VLPGEHIIGGVGIQAVVAFEVAAAVFRASQRPSVYEGAAPGSQW